MIYTPYQGLQHTTLPTLKVRFSGFQSHLNPLPGLVLSLTDVISTSLTTLQTIPQIQTPQELCILYTRMVSTALQEKYQRKFNVELRGGTRGGRDQFTWDSLKQMPYKARQMYLGVSSQIGILDKGGKYRKKDFYNRYQKLDTGDTLKDERLKALREDEARIAIALGEEPPGYEQTRHELSKDDRAELQKKILDTYQPIESGHALGMGFDKLKVQIRAKPKLQTENPHRIQGIEEVDPVQLESTEAKVQKKEVKREKPILGRQQRLSVSRQKKIKKERKQKKSKEQKRSKKDRKDKKEKKEKRHRHARRHSSSSDQESGRSRSRDRRH